MVVQIMLGELVIVLKGFEELGDWTSVEVSISEYLEESWKPEMTRFHLDWSKIAPANDEEKIREV